MLADVGAWRRSRKSAFTRVPNLRRPLLARGINGHWLHGRCGKLLDHLDFHTAGRSPEATRTTIHCRNMSWLGYSPPKECANYPWVMRMLREKTKSMPTCSPAAAGTYRRPRICSRKPFCGWGLEKLPLLLHWPARGLSTCLPRPIAHQSSRVVKRGRLHLLIFPTSICPHEWSGLHAAAPK
ncbi:hypothetical protein BS50DRAFT_267935 [Corynespora cassiicola Philippines]|uniref:Uncharacterized protein n=1 Tax=Corynespora cassiicola Philippines TaxID=1448308 RepID=A0A2T2NZD7_CORCC|nr:hypothetical protein BS50DRAFT_267935 [Corynespora cassiicola Philippines]